VFGRLGELKKLLYLSVLVVVPGWLYSAGCTSIQADQNNNAPATAQPSTSHSGSNGDKGLPGNPDPVIVRQTSKVDLGPYLVDVQRRIKQAWVRPKGKEAQLVTAVFKIHSDGKITDITLSQPSTDSEINDSALSAVKNAAPFPKLPDGADDPFEIQFTFNYTGGG